jgi:predicted metal-dependent peptidase
VITNSVAATHVAAAALRLIQDRPYLAAALWGLVRIQQPAFGTFALDRRGRLYYDPDTALAWTVNQVSAVLYHELCHLLRAHADRRPATSSPGQWNVATDLEINDDLRAEHAGLPEGALHPGQFGLPVSLLAEEYDRRLPRSGSKGSTQQKQPSKSKHSKQPNEPRVTSGGCGSCAASTPRDIELEAAAGSTGLTEGELVIVRRQVALAIQHQLGRGGVPGHWHRWAAAHLEPQVDWRRELAALVRSATAQRQGAVDYSYARPSRRQSCYGGVVRPSLREPVVQVAVIVDTSGSMDQHDLAVALAEVQGVLQAVRNHDGIPVLAVDAAVQTCRRVMHAEQVVLAGGGGTDMGQGLAAITKLRPRPQVAVVLTDGETPWPEYPPRGISVVVALTRAGSSVPSWARGVIVETGGRSTV